MRVIGLTGGIGSGKSTVGRLLAERGAIVIDADQVARQVVEPGRPALAEIATAFGEDVLQADGSLDRAALAAVVFADDGSRSELEAITHPRIGEVITQSILEAAEAEAAGGGASIVVVEHPLLVETGQADRYEALVVVLAPLELRLSRLVGRGLTEADARARIAAQATDQQRRAAATHVVDNAGSLADLNAQVGRLWSDLGDLG